MGEELFDVMRVSQQVNVCVTGVVGDAGHEQREAAAAVGDQPAPEDQVLSGAPDGSPDTAPQRKVQHDHGVSGP